MTNVPKMLMRCGSNVCNWLSSHSSRLPMLYPLSVYGVSRFTSSSSSAKSATVTKESITKFKEHKTPREDLMQKIPELIFSAKNNKTLGDCIVCWHPEVPFPYEMSKPLPSDTVITDSHLKIQALTPFRDVFRKKNHKLVVRELMHLTYTTKHSWFGKRGMGRKRYLKLMNPNNQRRSRPFL